MILIVAVIVMVKIVKAKMIVVMVMMVVAGESIKNVGVAMRIIMMVCEGW